MSVISELSAYVEQSPHSIAFQESGQSLTAGELYQSACELAFRLQKLEIEPRQNIGLLLPRGLSGTIAVYGILMAGACYVPIDTQNPQQRLRLIICNAQCRCIIGQGPRPQWLDDIDASYLDMDTVSAGQTGRFTPTATDPEQIAALLYTSGSTGVPKGVAIPHRAITAFAEWGRRTFSIRSDDRIASLTPFHFDLSLFDLFTVALAGATTIYIPDNLKLAPSKLVDWLIKHKVTGWYTVPSILRFLVLKGGLTQKSLPDLRQILFAGEVFPVSGLRQLAALLPDTKLYNLFGPTETNVCLYWPVQPQCLQSQQPIPIGRPACAADVEIDSQTNELLVKGPCVMAGYWNQGEADLPVDDQGWFHTGDKVCLNEHAEFEYLGRLDRMIKSAGYRVEPAEIEAALNSVSGVAGAAVVGIDDPVMGNKVAAAVAGCNLSEPLLRRQLQELLPVYMQPHCYLILENLPVLSNGKTDYRKITQIMQAREKNGQHSIA